MNIPLSDALDLVRSSKYQESELDQILDFLSINFGISFRIFDYHVNGDKIAIEPRWTNRLGDPSFIEARIITHEFKNGIRTVFGKDTREAKELVLTTLIGNVLFRGELNETFTSPVDSVTRIVRFKVCEIPVFSCLNELKLKLAIMKG